MLCDITFDLDHNWVLVLLTISLNMIGLILKYTHYKSAKIKTGVISIGITNIESQFRTELPINFVGGIAHKYVHRCLVNYVSFRKWL